MWASVGGHLEPEEIGDPELACYREIEEETGMTRSCILDLKLQYVLLRLNRSEFRQQFVYTAYTSTREVWQTDEGELYWIPREQVLDREIPFIFHKLLEHYWAAGPSPHIWLGAAGLNDHGLPEVRFTPFVDPLV
jgi:8-oxo-dGTP diphosphatase